MTDQDRNSGTARSLAAAVGLAWSSGAGRLVVRVVLAVVASAVPVAVAWLMKVVLDRLTVPDRPLMVPVLLLAAAGVAAVLLPLAIPYADAELRRAIDLTARRRLYAAVARMPGLRHLENPRFQDRLSLATETGTTGPSEVVAGGLGGVQGLLMLAGFVATLAVLNPWMLVPVAMAGLVAMNGQLRLSRYRARLHGGLGHATRREFFYAQLLNSPSAAKEVRLYGLGGLFGARMLAELRWSNARRRQMDRRELVVQGLHGAVGALVAGAGLVWAVHAARAGRLTVGDVSMFVAAVAGVQDGLTIVISSVGRTHEALLLFGHYRYVVDAGPDLPEPPPATRRPVRPLRKGVELRDVWFRYGDDLPWVLRGVTMTIPAGRATALVGPNGSGKSTLVKLLCRFYDPTRGAVLWDGVDLRDLPVDELRLRIGTVFQDYMAYELSAADNIGLGNLTELDERDRVVAAARRAGIHDTLAALPRGYDTMLSRAFESPEHDDPGTGVMLSGGQWQRVALARALMRDRTDLLILDEPSSGLDAEAEAEVHQRLREHRAGRTGLLISHRLSAVRDADAIVVLSEGAVVEQGDHDGLLSAGGLYARLFGLQAAGYRDRAWP
ncbi:ATP-binding cassette, subfamily B [Thermomonospora echinospora]|uniref:ATP-binding cassette, subfamily B n=1 Tax=Thermomonospora echinospora TaxID=1992 RepID=A0A1H6BFE0_9ACTN|nr:ABC transporter ATP-binding protein [Thermomonospora echinospora]SEG59382.1 ATP-binding cassette, subfamily B [Thermomonospora echinospora]